MQDFQILWPQPREHECNAGGITGPRGSKCGSVSVKLRSLEGAGAVPMNYLWEAPMSESGQKMTSEMKEAVD